MFKSSNALLARIDAEAAANVHPHLKAVELRCGEVLGDAEHPVQRVTFPDSGIVSCVVKLGDGAAIETAMIGRDGQFGAGHVLDDQPCFNTVTVQAPGTAWVIETEPLRAAAAASPSLRKLLAAYEQFLFGQAQQAVACNAAHDVLARMCRWLLRMHDLAGADLPVTQQLLAQMMGVTRTSVSATMAQLQRQGLLTASQGVLHILDVARIGSLACECHAAVAGHYRTLMDPRAGAKAGRMAVSPGLAGSGRSAPPPGQPAR